MKYADSSLCPQCRSALQPHVPSCTVCGLDLTTQEVTDLWATLVKADEQLALAVRASAGHPAAPSVQASPIPTNFQPTPQRSTPRVDTGSVLLILGALFILVAGGIASALTLGVFALPLMTLVAGGMAYFADRKRLNVSAETMLFITAVLGGFTVGIPTWGSDLGIVVWSLIGLAFSWTFMEITKPYRNYVVPKVLSGLYALPLGLGALNFVCKTFFDAEYFELGLFWSAFVAAALVAVLAFSLHLRSWHLSSYIALAPLALLTAMMLDGAWESMFKHASDPASLVTDWYGFPMVLLIAVFARLAIMFQGKLHRYVSMAFVVAAFTHFFALTWTPLADASPRMATMYAFGLALATMGLMLYRWNPWTKPLALGGVAPLALAVLYYFGLLLAPLVKGLEGLYDSAHRSWAEQLVPFNNEWWLFLLAGAALTLYFLLLALGPVARAYRREALYLAVLIGVVQIPLLSLFLAPTYLTVGAAVLAGAVLASTTLRRYTLITLVGLALAPLVVAPHAGVAAALCLAACVVSVVLHLTYKPSVNFADWTLGLAGASAMAVPVWAGLQADWPASSHTLFMAVAAVGGFTVASLLRQRGYARGVVNELAALALTLLALTAALQDASLAWASLVAVAVGAPLFALGLWDESRPAYRYGGSALLGLAWVLRLAASDVSTPEAYTAPFAAALLLFGAYSLYRRPAVSSTRALSAGLTLGILPSIIPFLADPVSLRGLLLGAFAAVLLFIAAYAKLRAPFIAAALTLAFIAVVEFGPYVLMLPQVYLFVVFGVLFLFMGVTWEARVRDSKMVATYIENMR